MNLSEPASAPRGALPACPYHRSPNPDRLGPVRRPLFSEWNRRWDDGRAELRVAGLRRGSESRG